MTVVPEPSLLWQEMLALCASSNSLLKYSPIPDELESTGILFATEIGSNNSETCSLLIPTPESMTETAILFCTLLTERVTVSPFLLILIAFCKTLCKVCLIAAGTPLITGRSCSISVLILI